MSMGEISVSKTGSAGRSRAAVLFAVALAFRLGIYAAAPVHNLANDSFYYVPVATEIAKGHGIQFIWKWSEINAVDWADRPPDEREAAEKGHPAFKIVPEGIACKLLLADPGYSFFLAFWYLLGLTGHSSIIFVQCILASLLAPALYTYVRRRTSESHATAAALLYALDPLATSTCFFILREIFVMLVVTTAVFALDLAGRFASAAKGALLGLGTLSFSLLGLWSIALWVWDRWLSPHPPSGAEHPCSAQFPTPGTAPSMAPRRRAVTLSVVLAAWFVFGIWSARNIWLSQGNYMFRRTQTAILLYYTANYDFPGLPNVYNEDFRKVWLEAGQRFRYGFTVNQRQHETEILKATWDIFKSDPVKVVWRFVKCNFWFWTEVPGSMALMKDRSYLHTLLLLFHITQMLFFVAGAGLMFKAGDAPAFRFVWGTVAYVAIFIFPFMPIPRYYTPFLPLIDVVSAYGAVTCYERLFGHLRRRV